MTKWEEGTLDLGIPAPPPKRSKKVAETKKGVTYSRYRVLNPVHCDLCLTEIHQKWPNGTHAPNRAVFRRVTAKVTEYLCWVHGEQRHREDGLNPPKRA